MKMSSDDHCSAIVRLKNRGIIWLSQHLITLWKGALMKMEVIVTQQKANMNNTMSDTNTFNLSLLLSALYAGTRSCSFICVCELSVKIYEPPDEV